MMRSWLILTLLLAAAPAWAVTKAEDIAAAITLRGHDCGGNQVTDIRETQTPEGGQTITARCPNGKRYQIDVSADGRLTVKLLVN